MKIRNICLVSLVLITCLYNIGFSQEVDNNKKPKQSGMFIGLSVGPSHSQIINEGTTYISKIINTGKNSYFGSINIGYSFSRFFDISSGLGIKSFNSQASIDTYQSKLNSTDSENDKYERQVSATGVKEIQKVNVLSIPLSLTFRVPFGQKVSFFLQPGISLILPLSKSYKSSGTFTYKGYYQQYDILLENLPSYGFPSNKSTSQEGKLNLISQGFNVNISAGFDFALKKNLRLAIAGDFDKALSSVSNYPSPYGFQLSPDVNQINSLMGGSARATIQSLGLVISLRYHIN
jgi:hypothetical protein